MRKYGKMLYLKAERLEAKVNQLEADNERLEVKVKELEAERNNATQTKVCHWTLEDDDMALWRAECGEEWCFYVDGPKENNMNFCPC